MDMEKSIAVFEIFLLIVMSFSIAYLFSETNDYYQGVQTESSFIKKSRTVILSWLSGGLVSAQSDVYYTCYENVNGTLCQTYPSDDCEDLCVGSCIPSDKKQYTRIFPNLSPQNREIRKQENQTLLHPVIQLFFVVLNAIKYQQ